MNRRLAALGLAIGVLAPSAPAHDFWIEPTLWQPKSSDVVGLQLFVGHHDEKDAVARKPERIERFFAALPATGDAALAAGTKDVVGAEGRAPAGYLRIERSGLHAIGYRSKGASIELEAEKFVAYLREEGLEHAIEERTRHGEAELPGRESYSRSAKSLFIADGGASAGFDRPIGLALELVPIDDPFALEPMKPLRLRLFLNGEPLSGVRIDATRLANWRDVQLEARTDEHGLVRFALPEGKTWHGAWIFAGVHMTRAAVDAEHDWESIWTSLTFEVPSPVAAAAAAAK